MGIPVSAESDLGFVARMLLATRSGDQVTRQDDHRLHEIAEHGYTKGGVPPTTSPLVDETMGAAARGASRA